MGKSNRMKLEHIALTISDSNELNNFYHGILGFKFNKKFALSKELSKQIFNISTIPAVNLMQRDNIFLEIFIYPKISKQKYNHICLAIKNRTEICKKAIDNGYTCIHIKRDISDLIFIKDKSGNIFELKP